MFIDRSCRVETKTIVSPSEIYTEILSDTEHGFLSYEYAFEATGEEYVLLPACCYDGNRFRVLKKAYPPLFAPEEAGPNVEVTITDVPRLNPDGSGSIEITTGDLSVPCIGVFSEKEQQGMLLFTVQQIGGVNLGIRYEKGSILLSYPHMRRDHIYRWPYRVEASDNDRAFVKGETYSIPYKLFTFDCVNIVQFYRIFFEHRKCMQLDDQRPITLSFDRQFEIQRNKFNDMNWYDGPGFYGTEPVKDACFPWQPGWVGGGITPYALMKLGGHLETERAIKTLRHLFRTQGASGFFYGCCDADGKVCNGILTDRIANWHLLRESADVMAFLFKYFSLMQERNMDISRVFIDGTRKLADAFVSLWERYGQLGQFVDIETGELVVGGSTSAAIASAGLALAAQYFDEPRYMEVAQACALQYYERDALSGYTCGGPEEILQGPDSESAFGLLESLVVLHEQTGDAAWLSRAQHVAHLCASWVVAYNYRFPTSSEFGKLGMKTVGAIFANVQNKHAAPGICTLSGDSLVKLYQRTGDALYLELIEDIALTISQYMSTDERPIYSWDVPKDAVLSDAGARAKPEKLPQGYICERVNLSDWETERCIGGVFNGSCWSETSNLLTLAEVVPLLCSIERADHRH